MDRNETDGDRALRFATEMLKLGISQQTILDLLRYPFEEIENQLAWLPYRNAKRPGGFLIEAIKHRYKPPKEFYYANYQTQGSRKPRTVDQDPERRDR